MNKEKLEQGIESLQEFVNDWEKWDTREFTQCDMVSDIESTIKLLKEGVQE